MSATAVILAPGETLGGFRLGEVVGVGGMAVVYRARQLSLNREVAVKVLSPDLAADELFSERFRREGMHVAQLDHPNIVPIYDAGEDRGRLFLAMRLVDGMTLAERMRTKPLSASETLAILGPIADGLDAAHAIGLVHRDIKPQNILVTERGHPYLADFGVAKGVESAGLTASGGFVGTLHYAAPEQILGSGTSPTTDVYALTAVLFHCLTGTVPYPRETQAGVIYAQVNQSPPQLPLAEALEFNLLIARGMAKDPGDRYASAGELIAAAERAVRSLPRDHLARRPTFSASPDSSTWSAEPVTPRRETASADRPRMRRIRTARRPVLAISACLAIITAAVVAASLGGRAAAASWRTSRSGSLTIRYRRPWVPTQGAFGAFVLTPTRSSRGPAPIELKSGMASLAAGSLARSAAVPGGPPPALLQFGHPARATSTLAGGVAVPVYSWTLSRVRELRAWVIPTIRGDLAVICSAPVGATRTLAACEAMARSARVSRGSLLPVGPDARLARSLGRIVEDAVAGRDTLPKMFRPGRKPADAPNRIATADARAARLLSRLTVPPRYRSAVTGLATGFGAETRALRNLAHASTGTDRSRYGKDAKAVKTASRRLGTLSGALRREGLLASAIKALDVPTMPVSSGSGATSRSTNGGFTGQPAPPPTVIATGSSSSNASSSTGSPPSGSSPTGSSSTGSSTSSTSSGPPQH